jgi:hypothetical protein
MIERLEPNPDLLVRHDGNSFVKERQVRRLGAPDPVKSVTFRDWTDRFEDGLRSGVFREYPYEKLGGPETRPAQQESIGRMDERRKRLGVIRGRKAGCRATFPCRANTKRVLRLFSRSCGAAPSGDRLFEAFT